MEHEETKIDQELEENPLITLEYPFAEELKEQDKYTQEITCDQEFEEISINELENQTEDGSEELEELEKTIEIDENVATLETVEITNDVQPEDEKQSQQSITLTKGHTLSDIGKTSIQQLFNILNNRSIETKYSEDVLKPRSFTLTIKDEDFHDFSLNSLDTEISTLEKMLKEVESPRLLTQFHPQIEDDVKQSLEVQTFQSIHEHDSSLELVSQGPSLPEPPPYDFQAELDELEEEQDSLTREQLLKSFERAQWTQMTANLDLAKQKLSFIKAYTSHTPKADPPQKMTQTFQNKQISRNKADTEEQIKKEKTESNLEKKNYFKPLEETLIEQNIERKRQSIIQTGYKAIKTGKHSDLRVFARKWNEHITRGGRPTTKMWEMYNKIQEKYDKPIVLYKESGNNTYRMSICGKLFSQLDSGNISARQINKIFEYWQIQSDMKKGIKPFLEVTIKNPTTGKTDTFWIPNSKQKAWNPYKAKNREFFNIRSSSWAKITEFLATKIQLNEKDIKLYNEIEKSLRKRYPKLGIQTVNGPFTTLGNQKVLFKNIYKLNYPKDVIDEAIKLAFWKYAGTHAYNDTNTVTSRKEITQMRIEFSNFGNSIQKNKITQRIYNLSVDGSVSHQNWTDDLESSIKSLDPNFIIYENVNGEINGISAPHLVRKFKDLLFFKDKYSVKSAGRMFNNLIALADYEPPLNLGTYYWKKLFPKNTDLHQLGIPEAYQTTFIYRDTTSSGAVGRARWMNDFRNEFLMPLTDWLKVSELKDFSKQITIQNPSTGKKYRKRFNNLSAYLKFQAGLGEWKDERWQGVYNKIYVLKYDLEHILAITKYVSESVQLPGRDNRTGKDKEKLLEFFQTTNAVKIINIVPESKNFKFIVSLSSRKQALMKFYNNLTKNSSVGAKIVQAHLTSVLESCIPLTIDPWTIQKAVNHKHLIKAPESLAELLTEEGDGPINPFCSGLFMDSNFREICNTVHDINFNMKFLQYPNTERDYIITQSMKSRKMADTYGESFTAASIPDVVTSYQKNSGSTELLFIKVVSNNIFNHLESDISEILKTNYDSKDPFRIFTALVFLKSDLNTLPLNSTKYNELMLLLQNQNADGLINIEIPDLQTKGLNRFGEIWASLKNEYITNEIYEESRNEFLKDPDSFKNQLIEEVMKKINSFQKLNPVDRKTVEEGLEIIDFEATTRTEFIMNTLMNYFSLALL
ncbi:MAG: hypothetical protein ACFFB5_21680 [Promethearchaeota archaeon]